MVGFSPYFPGTNAMPSNRQYLSVQQIRKADPEIWEGHIALLREAILAFHETRWRLFDEFVKKHGSDFGMQDPRPVDAILATVENVQLIGAVLFPAEWKDHVERLERMKQDEDRRLFKQVSKKKSTTAFRIAVFERDAYRCVLCGDWRELQVDHRIPESKGGLTCLDNLQTLCGTCNRKKHAKMPVDINHG